jgi:hypothetical protein
MYQSDRSHRRAMWLILGLMLAFAATLIGYELNWIFQRRAALAEPFDWADHSSPTANPPLQFQGAPGRRIGRLEAFIMRLCGEPETELFFVHHSGNELDLLAKIRESNDPDGVIEGLSEVQRARWLFPEAAIAVECYPPPDSTP